MLELESVPDRFDVNRLVIFSRYGLECALFMGDCVHRYSWCSEGRGDGFPHIGCLGHATARRESAWGGSASLDSACRDRAWGSGVGAVLPARAGLPPAAGLSACARLS